MTHKLRLSVFRFDAKSDYLPFYKKHIIEIDKEKSLDDLLAIIKEEDRLFDYPTDKNAAIKIGGENLFTKTKIDDIVEHFGDELTLMPMSEKRALKDLIVDKSNFYEKFDLIDAFVDSSDKDRFEELIIYHFASDIYRYSDDFQGDALSLFAYEMIEKYPEYKNKILDAIDTEDGVWLHTNICNKIFPNDNKIEFKIDKLKNDVIKARAKR